MKKELIKFCPVCSKKLARVDNGERHPSLSDEYEWMICPELDAQENQLYYSKHFGARLFNDGKLNFAVNGQEKWADCPPEEFEYWISRMMKLWSFE